MQSFLGFQNKPKNIQHVHKQIAKFAKNVFIAFLDELGNFKQFFAKLAISQIDNHTGQ